jgi:hypothetical protein
MFQATVWWGQSAGSSGCALIHNTCVDPMASSPHQSAEHRKTFRPDPAKIP